MNSPPQLKLSLEFTYVAELGPSVDLGAVPDGRRITFPILGGTATGARINGALAAGGGDWMLIRDGWGELDVRGQITTHDGATLNISYRGVLELTDAFFKGQQTSYEEQYFRTAPRLESGDPRYSWVNHTIFVAQGRIVSSGVEYEVFRVQ